MAELTHGFKIDTERCNGCLACMRACPTQAVRIRHGVATVLPRYCIDCGCCLLVCPRHAILATTRPFAEIHGFKYKVAVPSPVLFGQFPLSVSPAHIVAGLCGLGFDAVWDFTVELSLFNRAVGEYVDKWEGPYPLISVLCPVVVRLIQVLYPSMVDQLIRIQPPRELAGREIKRRYSAELGLDPQEIAAIYITPCQAKTISILEPAEEAKSNLDGALGISDIYNGIMAVTRSLDRDWSDLLPKSPVRSAEMLRWATSEGQRSVISRHRYMSVTGLSNVIQVFDDVEKGKLRNIGYLECDACWGGCIGGNLTVENIYITLSKIRRLLAELPENDPDSEAEVDQRCRNEELSLRGPLRPRVTDMNTVDLRERVQRIKAEETFNDTLPALDCGLCGAPSCKAFARDVAEGSARKDDCVFLSDGQLERLRQTYIADRRPTSE